MPSVQLQKGEPIERALRQFKRACEKAGIPQRARKLQHHVKRSEQKKLAKLAAVKRWRKKVAKSQQFMTRAKGSSSSGSSSGQGRRGKGGRR